MPQELIKYNSRFGAKKPASEENNIELANTTKTARHEIARVRSINEVEQVYLENTFVFFLYPTIPG